MASDFRSTNRRVVPNFRAFSDTVVLGELDLASSAVPDPVRIDFRSRLAEWNAERTVGLAGDIVSAALISNETDLPVIDEAATFIVAHSDICSSSLTSTAHKVLTRAQPMPTYSVQLPRLATFLESNSRQNTYRKIHALKNATTRFGNDPILFTELARLYLIVGNEEKAKKNMAIAISLAPDNRYVLRSAARLYAHCDEAERGFDLLHRNPRSRYDPWLASAKLAMAGLVEKSNMILKGAGRILESDKFSPFSLTELRAGVGSRPTPPQSGRHRRFQGLVNPCRARAARLPTILRTSPSTGTPAASLRSVLGEGGGLSEPRPARGGQLPPQLLDLPLLTLDLALQAVDLTLLATVLALLVLGVALAPRQLRAEPFDLGLQVLVRIAVPDLHAKGYATVPKFVQVKTLTPAPEPAK